MFPAPHLASSDLEEAWRSGGLSHHLAVPASASHQVHLALLVVELHVEEGCILPALGGLLLQLLLWEAMQGGREGGGELED